MPLQHAPRRRQPRLSWLLVGAAVTVAIWLAGSVLLALYVVAAAGFGDTYGPLIAGHGPLIWANVTGRPHCSLVRAGRQLEAVRAGLSDPRLSDPRLSDNDGDGIPDALDGHPSSPAP